MPTSRYKLGQLPRRAVVELARRRLEKAAERLSREYDFGEMRVWVKLIFTSSLALSLGACAHRDSPFCGQKADNSKAVRSKSTLITKIEGDAVQYADYLGAERWMQKEIPYESWSHVADRLSRDVISNTSFPPRHYGQPSLLKEDGYRKEMTGVLQKPFRFQFLSGNQVDVLVNGPASFANRKKLIEQARESIYMFAWAFYDDGTGWEFADWLINAKLKRLCEGGDLDIKIVVDGNVVKEIGYRDVLNYLEKYPSFSKSPIQIVRLKDKRDPYMGMHRKVMIVDRQYMVMGGMNVGNIYSHLYPDKGGRWRDTDIYVRGPAINQAQMTFVDEWNEQRGRKELTFLPYDFGAPSGEGLSMIVDHQPLRDDNIHIATVKAFYGASQSIDIENAYFILDAVMERALVDALKRGVRVRILSNSKDSIDEPVIAVPILQSLARLKKQGAEVFTKKVYDGSTTLHSKFLLVDGVFCWIGSYNFHPRSYRYEREIVFASFDENLAAQFGKIFAEDIAPERATKPSLEELLNVKSSLLNKEVSSHFFDQL